MPSSDYFSDPIPGVTTGSNTTAPSPSSPSKVAAQPQSGRQFSGGTWFNPVYGDSHYNPGSYGYKKPPEKGGHIHYAIDIFAKSGQPVVAPITGTVTAAGYGEIAGYYVKLRGSDGIDYYFAHLKERPPVAKGQVVAGGTAIGSIGATGNAKGTSPHVHFSMKYNGKHINPHSWMQSGQQQSLQSILELANVDAQHAEYWERQAELLAPYADPELGGMDTNQWFKDVGPPESLLDKKQTNAGAFLGSMMNGLSNRVAGGSRTPIARSPVTLGAGNEEDLVAKGPESTEIRNTAGEQEGR